MDFTTDKLEGSNETDRKVLDIVLCYEHKRLVHYSLNVLKGTLLSILRHDNSDPSSLTTRENRLKFRHIILNT